MRGRARFWGPSQRYYPGASGGTDPEVPTTDGLLPYAAGSTTNLGTIDSTASAPGQVNGFVNTGEISHYIGCGPQGTGGFNTFNLYCNADPMTEVGHTCWIANISNTAAGNVFRDLVTEVNAGVPTIVRTNVWVSQSYFPFSPSSFFNKLIKWQSDPNGDINLYMDDGGGAGWQKCTNFTVLKSAIDQQTGVTRKKYVKAVKLSTTGMTNVNYGPVNNPLYIEEAGWNNADRTFTFTIRYQGAPPPDGHTVSWDGGTTNQRLTLLGNPSAGLAYYKSPVYPTGSGLVNLRIAQLNSPTTYSLTSVTIPTAARIGANDNAGGSYNDLAYDGYRYTRGNSVGGGSEYRIRRAGDIAYGITIPGSNDGLGGTVLFNQDGAIGPNSLGITEYDLVAIEGANLSDYWLAGQCEIVFTPAVTVTGVLLGGISGWTPQVGQPGVYRFQIDRKTGHTMRLGIPVSQLSSATPMKFTIKRVGGSAGKYNEDTLANLPRQAMDLRFLDPSGINNLRTNNGSRTATSTRDLTNRSRVGLNSIEEQVARCNAFGAGLWCDIGHIDVDALVTHYANYIAANLAPGLPVRVGLGNEFFNVIFGQWWDSHILAARAGLAETTPSDPPTPVTIIDPSKEYHASTNSGSDFPVGSDVLKTTVNNFVTSSMAVNDIPANTNFVFNNGGVVVYTTRNSVIPANTTFSFTDPAFATLKYTVNQCATGQYRWISRRLKQIAAIFNARFDAAGRPRPDIVLAYQAANFSPFAAMLNWDNLKSVVTKVSGAWYYGADGTNLVDYDGSVIGWLKADVDVLYNSGAGMAGVNALIAKYLAVSPRPVKASNDRMYAFKADISGGANTSLAKFNIDNGTNIGLVQYEWNHHLALKSNWPCRAGFYQSGNTYSAGALARSSDWAVYKAKSSVPPGNPPVSSPAYWDVLVSPEVMTSFPTYGSDGVTITGYTTPSDKFINTLIRHAGHAADISWGLNDWINRFGDLLMVYTRTSNGLWGTVQNEADVGIDNPAWQAIAAARTGL